MKRHHPFAAALVRARREQGFASGHAFYRARDGRRAFGMLYANYMALERGASLPKSWRLEAILKALDLSPASPQWQELVRAYLASLLGSDALLKGLLPAPAESALSSEEVAREALRLNTVQLDLEQWRALARAPAAYYCHVYLVNTPGWSKASELAQALRLTPVKVREALSVLAKARLI